MGLSYRPRAIRKLSSIEIDAFNQGLHSKRPKFIGKRRVPSSAPDGLAVDKRRRKFMGKKSDVGAAATVDETRSPMSLDKRGPRKFMGRRAEPHDYRNEYTRLTRQLESRMKSALDKRARRKFVGWSAPYNDVIATYVSVACDWTNRHVIDT